MTGFAAAGLLGALAGATGARAQSAQDVQRAGEPVYPSGPSLPQNGPRSADQTEDTYAAPGIPPAIPLDDPTEERPEDDGLQPTPRAGQRAVVQDGDLTDPAEPQLRDGIVDVGEPLPAEDGTDPSTVDTRDAEDLAVFENPPAGHDPLLFQIEDIDPITDNRRTRRLASLEPFDPVGIKIGSFVLFPEAEFSTSRYSNVFRSPNAEGDWALDVLPSMRLVSNWDRHALEFSASADTSFYSKFDSENDKGYLFEGRGRLDITRRTNVQALLSHERSQESRSALDASSVGSRANVTTDRAEAALNHRFNRLSLQFRGSVGDFSYGEVESLGTSTSNSDRDYTQTEETVRATWEFKPTLSAFTEVAVNQRDYDEAAQSDLINRSSDGERYRAGLSFGNTGRVLRGEISLGYGIQRPHDSRLQDIEGLLVDANATWRVTEATSLLFNARSDVSETTTANVGGSMYRFYGLEARHAFRTYLIGSAGLTLGTQNSQDGIIDESEIRATLGVEYYLNRETMLFTRYAHTEFNAIGIDSDYSSDEVHVGVQFRR